MRPYVHILGRDEIDSKKARSTLSIEHWGNMTRFWVENDEHEPHGYRLSDPGMPSWKVIICGNEICIVEGCVRKAYFEQLHLPTVEEVIERDTQRDAIGLLEENMALAEESEARRQEIERLTEVIKNLNGQIYRYQIWIQTTIQVLDESDPEMSDHALAAELRQRMEALDQGKSEAPAIPPELQHFLLDVQAFLEAANSDKVTPLHRARLNNVTLPEMRRWTGRESTATPERGSNDR